MFIAEDDMSIMEESMLDASDICEDIIDESIIEDELSIIDDDIIDESMEDDIMELSIIDDEDMSPIADDDEASCERAPVASRADRTVPARSCMTGSDCCIGILRK